MLELDNRFGCRSLQHLILLLMMMLSVHVLPVVVGQHFSASKGAPSLRAACFVHAQPSTINAHLPSTGSIGNMKDELHAVGEIAHQGDKTDKTIAEPLTPIYTKQAPGRC